MKRNETKKRNCIKRWIACFLALYMAFSPMNSAVAYADSETLAAADASADTGSAGDLPVPKTVSGDEKEQAAAENGLLGAGEDAGVYEDSPTELPNKKLDETSSESTAFQWKQGMGANETYSSWRFDFCGLQNGQTEYSSSGIQTTWKWKGYPTYLGIADEHGAPPQARYERIPGKLYKYDGGFNGAAVNTGLGKEGKTELRITIEPSTDHKYLYVNYDVYNGNTEKETYYLGSGADSMINQDDTATCYQNSRGFHMVSTQRYPGDSRANKVFDCVTNDPDLGVSPKPDYRYVGGYSNYIDNMFTKTDQDQDSVSGDDSGIAYGWKFDVRPYETIHRRVAFAIRSTSYYVSTHGSDSDSAMGTYDSPFKTIQYAIDKIGENKGYIYLMDPETRLMKKDQDGEYKPIVLNQGANQQITIASTDYDSAGNPQIGQEGYIKKLTAEGTAFQVSNGATLTLTDITLDGENTSKSVPMVSASGGTLVINSGTTIQNCKGTDSTIGSAVDVTGSAKLTLNSCTIKDNLSPAGGRGAVHFAGSGAFEVNGNVQVTGNMTSPVQGDQGTVVTPAVKANVYLDEGKTITVTGDLGSGESGAMIGVTTAKDPDVSPEGSTTKASQEVLVAVPAPGTDWDTSPCPFAENFTADQAGSYIAYGIPGLPDTVNNDHKTVRRIDGYTIRFVRRDKGTQAEIPGSKLEDQHWGPGADVTIPLPAGITNYTLDSVTVDPAPDPGSDSLSVQDDKTVKGRMPAFNVTIYYDYSKIGARIEFDPKGAAAQIPPLDGHAGETPMGSLPYVSCPGYTFKGWSDARHPGTLLSALPTFENGTITLEANYEPDQSQKFDYTVTHENVGGTIKFKEPDIQKDKYYVEQAGITEPSLAIHGYRWSSTQSNTSPSNFNFRGQVDQTGVFDPDSNPPGQLTVKMPAQALTVNFRYEVDSSNEQAGSPFTVRHRLGSSEQPGRELTDAHPIQVYPEETISAEPKPLAGYTCVDGKFTKGAKENGRDPAVQGIQTDAQGNFDPVTHILKNGVMPNRETEITYYYQPAGDTYGLTVQHQDLDVPNDLNLQNISSQGPFLYTADAPVSGEYTSYHKPYGYADVEESDKTILPAAAMDGGLHWTGADQRDFTGTMPNQTASVTYRHHRDGTKWNELTYQPGVSGDGQSHGSLSAGEGVSPYVTETDISGVYHASVLMSDQSGEGEKNAWRWSAIRDKKLIPKVTCEPHYICEGWFIDADHNGRRQSNQQAAGYEPLLEDGAFFTVSQQTDDPAHRLTASIIPDPNDWCTIHLAVSHGTMSEDAKTDITVPKGQNWDSIQGQLPAAAGSGQAGTGTLTAEPNYVEGDWYQEIRGVNVKMDGTAPLTDNATYTYRFKPDPEVFGTEAKTPDALALLDNFTGTGQICVYTYGRDIETTDYQYVVTDMDGIVVAVKTAEDIQKDPQIKALGRLMFDQLYPGTRYQVYEARTRDSIYTGHPLKDSFNDSDYQNRDILSEPAEVLIPVVESNYLVRYDTKEDGKTVLTIQPADKRSDYAVLNKDGTVVLTPGQEAEGGWKHPVGSKTASVEFPGLTYNEEYIVVARPKEQTGLSAESKKDDGSSIVTDLGSAPELKNCVVETPGGTVTQVTRKGESQEGTGTARFATAHEGDRITIQADEGSGGNFQNWELLIGPDGGIKDLPGFDKKAETATFTMPDTNVVLHAVYEKTATPGNATVSCEMRGGKQGKLTLSPDDIPTLEEQLTTPEDRVLIETNKVKVHYKIVYQKTSVKATESDAIRALEDAPWYEDYSGGGSNDDNNNHQQAYKNLFGLNITAERYVDGRKVEASPSDATVRTYVQTGKNDSDLLDYRLYEITEEDGQIDVSLVAPLKDGLQEEVNPEDSGGLFIFDGQIGHRYVLVCSQAYRLYFINDTVTEEPGAFNKSIRMRKKEDPDGYMDDMEAVGLPPVMMDSWTDPKTGIHYHDPEWSYKNTGGTRADPFDFSRPITRKTIAYAWYQSDKKAVEDGIEQLKQAIAHAIEVGNDHFLHPEEQKEVFDFVQAAQNVLDKKDPAATSEELQEALRQLKQDMVIPEQKLAERYGDYDHIQNNKPSGGSGGGGGGGGGSRKNPYGSREPQNYQIPVNGSWQIVPGENGQPPRKQFRLNGGEPLKNMWAQLNAPDVTGGVSDSGPSGPASAGPATGQGWYHFDAEGNMQTGWLCDAQGKWYYLNTDAEGDAGRMQTGFKQTPGDPFTYYLDPENGAMVTGWREVDGKWRYFNPTGGNVYYYDPTLEQWIHGTAAVRPLGAMYQDDTTPDGYRVGPDGVWLP